MQDIGMTYTKLAERLRLKGYDVVAVDVFDIARRLRKAPRTMQEDIADILGCLRKDIF
jgi:uncharacterized UPF0146 family protein